MSFLLRRLASGIVLLVVGLVTVFLLVSASGTNVARSLLGTTASEELVQAKMRALGIDRPALVQLGDWWWRALRGDLGTSYTNSQPVTDLILSRTSVTLSLVIGALAVSVIAAIVLGTIAAVKGGVTDQLVQGVSVVGTALPGFWVALVLVTVFAVELRLFPATGYVRPEHDLWGWMVSLTLPILASCVAGVCAAAMQLRNSIIELRRRDFIRTLRSRGLSGRRILVVHVLRNAAPTTLTIVSLQFVGMLSGVVAIEQIFALPGLGSLAVSATSSGDTPVIMGIVTVMVTIVVIVNLVMDLANAWLNPKVRLR